MFDFRPGSLNFLAWNLNSSMSTVKLVGFARGFKLLLHVVLGCTIVDYLQQLLPQQQQELCLNVDCD